MYIEICYFAPINSTFYKKNNLDNNCSYNNLEQDIYSLKNEGNILLLGEFNARTVLMGIYDTPSMRRIDPDRGCLFNPSRLV
jgi:hypothetical protein